MAIDSLKDWKKTDAPGSAERRHRKNESTRDRDRAADQRQNASPLAKALENYKNGQESSRGDTARPKARIAQGIPSQKRDVPVKEVPVAKTAETSSAIKTAKHDLVTNPSQKTENGAGRPGVQTAANVTTSISTSASSAMSHFVVGTNRSPLSDLLLKKSNTPATPPKEEKRGLSDAAKSAPHAAELQQAVEAKGVQAPSAGQEGTKTGERKTESRETETRRHGERKTENGKRSGGARGAATTGAGSAGGEQALEAASAGVTAGGDGPVWIADMEPVGYTVNAETPMDENFSQVRDARDRFNKYLAKCVDAGNAETVKLFEKAIELDGKLGEILKRGLALRKNVYGGMNG